MYNNKKVGLVLSGGGARGYAHIGVLRAMEEFHIQPDMIAGTSMGSIIGALIANGYSSQEMAQMAQKKDNTHIFDFHGLKLGLFDHEKVRQILTGILPDSFEKLKLPFFVSATNLNQARGTIFSAGNLIDAVLASMSMPIVFKPMKIDNEYYVDGGLVKNLPASSIRQQCDWLIGSHVNHLPPNFSPDNTEQIMQRCISIAVANTLLHEKDLCDIFIDPEKSGAQDVLAFKHIDDIIEIGYEAAKKEILLQSDISSFAQQ